MVFEAFKICIFVIVKSVSTILISNSADSIIIKIFLILSTIHSLSTKIIFKFKKRNSLFCTTNRFIVDF